jgi:hypothetical protein
METRGKYQRMGICSKGGKACGGLYSQRISKVDGNDGGIGCAVTQAVSQWRITLNASGYRGYLLPISSLCFRLNDHVLLVQESYMRSQHQRTMSHII